MTKPSAVHKTLSDLDLYNAYDVKVTRVFRASKEMIPRPSLELFYGDILRVIGTDKVLKKQKKLLVIKRKN